MSRICTLTALVISASVSVSAQDQVPVLVEANPRFRDYKTFRCTFTESEGRDYGTTPPKSLHGESYPEIIVDNIDYAKRSARLIGNVGSGDVGLIDGTLSVTFIEVSDSGNVIIDTIFKANASAFDPVFRIATSRHIARPFAGDTVGQFYGTCRGLL